MSQHQNTAIDQAKVESKKLLKLALQDAGIIKITKLSEAQELIARIKGKADWHEFLQASQQLKVENETTVQGTPHVSTAELMGMIPDHWKQYFDSTLYSNTNFFEYIHHLHILRPNAEYDDLPADERASLYLQNIPEQINFVLVEGFTAMDAIAIFTAYNRAETKLQLESKDRQARMPFQIGAGRIVLQFPFNAVSQAPLDDISFEKNFVGRLGFSDLITYYPRNRLNDKQDLHDFFSRRLKENRANRIKDSKDLVRRLAAPLVGNPLSQMPPRNLPWHQYAFLTLLMAKLSNVDCLKLHYLMATTSNDEAIVAEADALMELPEIKDNPEIKRRLAGHAYFGSLILSFADSMGDKSSLVRGAFRFYNPLLAKMFVDFSGDSFLTDSAGVVAHYFSEVREKQPLSTPSIGQAFNRVAQDLIDYAEWKVGSLHPRVTMFMLSEPQSIKLAERLDAVAPSLYPHLDNEKAAYPSRTIINARLATGNDYQIATILERLFKLYSQGRDSENNIWMSRASELLKVIKEAVIPELVRLRDTAGFLPWQKKKLDVNALVDAISLEELVKLHRRGLSGMNAQVLATYLKNLPALDLSNADIDVTEYASQQHAYRSMILLHMLDQLKG